MVLHLQQEAVKKTLLESIHRVWPIPAAAGTPPQQLIYLNTLVNQNTESSSNTV